MAMTEEQRRYVMGTLKSGGAAWDGSPDGYRNGSGNKGIRYCNFSMLYTLAFPGGDALEVVNELLKSGELIAVTFEWRKSPDFHGQRGKARMCNLVPVSVVTEKGNPMLYLTDRVPRPVQDALQRLRKRAEKVSKLLIEAGTKV